MQYMTLRFKDNTIGRRKMESEINLYGQQGWRVVETTVINGRRSLTRTVGLGVLFLPLALKGKKADKVSVILEHD